MRIKVDEKSIIDKINIIKSKGCETWDLKDIIDLHDTLDHWSATEID